MESKRAEEDGCGDGLETERRQRQWPFINLSASAFTRQLRHQRETSLFFYDCFSLFTIPARANHMETFIASLVQKKGVAGISNQQP